MGLTQRIQSLERGIGGIGGGGIAKWALDYALCKASISERYAEVGPILDRILEEGGQKPEKRDWTAMSSEEVEAMARDLSENYTDLQDYLKRRPVDFSELKRILDEAEEKRK